MKRRDFIQALAIGAAGVSTASLFAKDRKHKQLGIQLYTVRDAVSANLEKTLTQLASLGYNKLEIYGYNGAFFGNTPAAFKTILNNTGMTVISSHHVAGFATKPQGSLSNGWEQAVQDLHSIGAKYMACSYIFPNERTPENYAALPALCNTCGQKSKEAGIQFAYHNHDFEFEPYNNTLVYDFLLNNTDTKLVKFELDLYWISKAGYDPIKYFNTYPGRFPLWHVKDMEAGTKNITEVGHGTIDFDRIFAARKKAGLEHWFVEQDTTKGDIFESIKSSHQFLDSKNYR